MADNDVERTYATTESAELIALVRQMCEAELVPNAAAAEAKSQFPQEAFRTLGASGLLALPYPKEYGGADLPFSDYLQVIEEIAAAWGTVALGISVHTLACFPLVQFGSDEQKRTWLPTMLSGETLGAYCLSETEAGSDAAALKTTAKREGDCYNVNGTKAWVSHGGVADFYALMARTSDDGARGISCFLVDATSPGLTAAAPESKLGFTASPTAQMHFENVRIPVERRIGDEGKGFAVAMAALDAGRLGMAACAVGIAQAALNLAVQYTKQRHQFGRAVSEFQGMTFLLADMATGVSAGRELYLAAARRKDAGKSFATEAAMAKLFATDMAMRVTTDAVQALGGAGYVRDFPAERYFREAKALQIVEGTNQIQRMVIGRALTRP